MSSDYKKLPVKRFPRSVEEKDAESRYWKKFKVIFQVILLVILLGILLGIFLVILQVIFIITFIQKAISYFC